MIGRNDSATVNLVFAGVDHNVEFYLSENTVGGTDFWSTTQAFKFDPNSEEMAVGSRYGSSLIGGLECQGLQSYNQAVEDAEALLSADSVPNAIPAAISEVLRFVDAGDGLDAPPPKNKYEGRATFPTEGFLLRGCAALMAHLISKGYVITISHDKLLGRLDFSMGPKGKDDFSGIDLEVKKYWEDAVESASRYKPANKGLKEI